jgi:dTDP-glucose 4,6-dehydratase
VHILITGGAGFIGSAVVRHLLSHTTHVVINVDKLTYAGNLGLASRHGLECSVYVRTRRHRRPRGDGSRFRRAPSGRRHVPRGGVARRPVHRWGGQLHHHECGWTYILLEAVRAHWHWLDDDARRRFRVHHISTDEVYGDLAADGSDLFAETKSYDPQGPYSASKALSDHLVRAWHRTYGLPTLITNCSNNYGPYQFPKKQIPHMILNALHGKPLPVYGEGKQVRDWLYVEDHAEALLRVLESGQVGETYNVGGENEQKDIAVVRAICDMLEELAPNRKPSGTNRYHDLITFVKDRPGRDMRYAIDAGKIDRELGWRPRVNFVVALRMTVQWFLDNEPWWQRALSGAYRLERIGGGGVATKVGPS